MSAIKERSVAGEKTGLIRDVEDFSEVPPTAKSPLHYSLEEDREGREISCPFLLLHPNQK